MGLVHNRFGAADVCFGINWKSQNENEWLEIKGIKIFIDN